MNKISQFFILMTLISCHKKNQQSITNYPIHNSITVSYFWVGEAGNNDNKDIPNSQSVWDDQWKTHYGGLDDPKNRLGYMPANFIPAENPFYFALPYNDYNSRSGERKKHAMQDVYWSNEKDWQDNESLCKNRWIKITKDTTVCYAQWEDAGPNGENDWKYVFGNKKPSSRFNDHAGLDVSPAVHDFLNLEDLDKVDWQFIDFDDVPDGPWKTIVTTSNVYWE
jgi:hypothetical protein